MCQCCVLNRVMCLECQFFNGHFQIHYSIPASPNKYMGAWVRLVIIGIPNAWLSSYIQCMVDTLFSLLVCVLSILLFIVQWHPWIKAPLKMRLSTVCEALCKSTIEKWGHFLQFGALIYVYPMGGFNREVPRLHYIHQNRPIKSSTPL